MLRDFTRSKRHLSHHNDNYRRNLQAAFRCAVYAAPAVGTSGISRPRERSSQRTRRLCSGPPLSSPPLGRTALQLRLLRPIQLVILLLILHILLALLILLPHPPLSLLLLLGPGEASRSAVHLPALVLPPVDRPRLAQTRTIDIHAKATRPGPRAPSSSSPSPPSSLLHITEVPRQPVRLYRTCGYSITLPSPLLARSNLFFRIAKGNKVVPVFTLHINLEIPAHLGIPILFPPPPSCSFLNLSFLFSFFFQSYLSPTSPRRSFSNFLCWVTLLDQYL